VQTPIPPKQNKTKREKLWYFVFPLPYSPFELFLFKNKWEKGATQRNSQKTLYKYAQ
jgi:hypothetical protein